MKRGMVQTVLLMLIVMVPFAWAGTITGTVFEDVNYGGAGLTLAGSRVKTVYSDARGVYLFGNVAPGIYTTIPEVPYSYEFGVVLEPFNLGFSGTILDRDIGLVSVQGKK